MSRLVIATNNQGKVAEIKAIIGGFYDEVSSLGDAGIDLDVEEDGDTFEANARKKAVEAAAITGCDTLADDSGLCVDALGGAPGVYSARFAGEHATYADNNAKLLADMAEQDERGAVFVCTLALVRGGEVIEARGQVRGEITLREYGKDGFGYDPLFFVPALGKTYAEISAAEKNAMSHRYLALAALKAKLTERQR